jgi:hypothetical protein
MAASNAECSGSRFVKKQLSKKQLANEMRPLYKKPFSKRAPGADIRAGFLFAHFAENIGEIEFRGAIIPRNPARTSHSHS